MCSTDLHLGTLSALEPVSGVFRTHSSGPVATNDCLRRGKRKNQLSQQRDPGLTVSYLGSIPAPLPVCSLPMPGSSREPVPAPAASNIGSKLFPGGQGPSCFYPDLPFQLFLNSASGPHRNLHLRSPSPRLQAQPSLCPGTLPRLPLLSESHHTFTAPLRGFVLLEIFLDSHSPRQNDCLPCQGPKVCPLSPSCFPRKVIDPQVLFSLCEPLEIKDLSLYISSPSAPSRARQAGVGGEVSVC